MRHRKRGPSSVKRAGAHVRRELWREAGVKARRNARVLAIFLASWVGVAVVMVVGMRVTGGSTVLVAFFVGIMVGLLPFFGLMFLVSWGIANRQMGGEAERWTADALAKLLDGRGWVVFHDVPLEYGNVDHVAVGPGRIYAIETKWTSCVEHEPTIKRFARQAEGRANALARRLSSRGVPREILPLLVVWGPGVTDRLGDKPRLEGTTRIVAGPSAHVWLAKMKDAADRVFIDGPARSAIAGLIEEAERV